MWKQTNGGRAGVGVAEAGGWRPASIQIERASLKIHTQADIDREADAARKARNAHGGAR